MKALSSFIVVLTLSFPGALRGAGAATAAEPSPSADEVAKEARRAYVVGNLEEAIGGFGHAYEMSGDASLLFELAEAQREAGHPVDALRSYQNYLRRAPAGIYRQNAERQIRELKKIRAAGPKDPGLPSPGPKSGAAPKTTVGSSVGSSAASASPGPAATRSNAPPVRAGAAEQRLGLAPAGRPTSSPAVAVIPAPAGGPEASPLDASARTGADLITAVPDVSPLPPRRWTAPRWLPIALGVLTVALGATAIASGLSASNRYDDLLRSCGQTGCSAEEIDSVKSRARLANIFWASTGVAAAGFGTTLYLHVRDNGASSTDVASAP